MLPPADGGGGGGGVVTGGAVTGGAVGGVVTGVVVPGPCAGEEVGVAGEVVGYDEGVPEPLVVGVDPEVAPELPP